MKKTFNIDANGDAFGFTHNGTVTCAGRVTIVSEQHNDGGGHYNGSVNGAIVAAFADAAPCSDRRPTRSAVGKKWRRRMGDVPLRERARFRCPAGPRSPCYLYAGIG